MHLERISHFDRAGVPPPPPMWLSNFPLISFNLRLKISQVFKKQAYWPNIRIMNISKKCFWLQESIIYFLKNLINIFKNIFGILKKHAQLSYFFTIQCLQKTWESFLLYTPLYGKDRKKMFTEKWLNLFFLFDLLGLTALYLCNQLNANIQEVTSKDIYRKAGTWIPQHFPPNQTKSMPDTEAW